MRSKGPNKLNEMVFEGKKMISEMAGQILFSNLYLSLHKEEFNEEFRCELDKMLTDIIQDEIGFNQMLVLDITYNKIQSSIKSLPLGKARIFDDLTYEHMVYGGEDLVKHLSHWYSLILHLVKIPSTVKRGLMIILLKPRRNVKRNPENHRRITLLPVLYKHLRRLH